MKIKIKNQEIELKRTMRSFIAYEQITNKPFNPKNLTDLIVYFYSVVIASKPDAEINLNEFISFLDENPDLFQEFNEWILKAQAKEKDFKKEELEQKKTVEQPQP